MLQGFVHEHAEDAEHESIKSEEQLVSPHYRVPSTPKCSQDPEVATFAVARCGALWHTARHREVCSLEYGTIVLVPSAREFGTIRE